MFEMSEGAVMRPARITILSCMFAVGLMVSGTAWAAGARDLHEEGLKALRAGNVEQAIELISKAIELGPPDVRYFNDRGVAFRRAGKLDRAIEDYTAALAIDPDFVGALNNRALAYAESGQYDKAIADFDDALRGSGPKGTIYTNRGLAHARMGRYKEAIADFRQAISCKPLDVRSFLYLAEALELTGEKDKALQMYQLAQEIVKDRKTVARIEERIAALEKTLGRSMQPFDKTRQHPAARHVATETPRASGKREAPPGSSGEKPVRLVWGSNAGSLSSGETSQPPGARPESLGALDDKVRSVALERFAKDAARIYRQGRKFLAASDFSKALIGFEDALQLARRNRNSYGMAWSFVEIARVHLLLGDYLKAEHCFKQAVELFQKAKSSEGAILALVELAGAHRKAGRQKEALAIYKEAVNAAAGAGDDKLAQAITGLGNSRSVGRSRRPAEVPRAQKLKKAPPSAAPENLSQEGSGPRELVGSPKKKPVSPAAQTVVRIKPASVDREPQDHQTAPQSRREVLWADRPRIAEKSIDQCLSLLRDLRAKGEQEQMIPVLEGLAEKYQRANNHKKALQSLVVALRYREERGLTLGMEKVLLMAGDTRAKLGKPLEALEDYAHCLALLDDARQGTLKKSVEKKAGQVAGKAGLDYQAAREALGSLWQARMKRDVQSEVQALLKMGRLCEEAGMAFAASDYYARSAACLLAARARLLESAGEKAQAEESLSEAIAALKRHDYLRYLQELRKSREIESSAPAK